MSPDTKPQLSRETIGDLIVTALEGGSNYWICTVFIERAGQEDYWEAPLNGGAIHIKELEGQLYTLDEESINRGVATMADDHPWHWDNLIKDEWDAETADVFIQCCAIGELTFG